MSVITRDQYRAARGDRGDRDVERIHRDPRLFPWRFDDGGRADHGFKGIAGDCVTRSIAIALDMPYGAVYRELRDRMADDVARARPGSSRARRKTTPRDGVHRDVYEAFLFDYGWVWAPTMSIGGGCTTHLRPSELPDVDRIIARLSRHITAVVDGTIRDTHDPSRSGTRCVYGYFIQGAQP